MITPPWTRGVGIVVATIVGWLLASSVAIAAPSPAPDWDAAQAVEADGLRAELRSLEKSLAAARTSSKTAKSSLRAEIDGISKKVTRLRVDNARSAQRLPAAERARSQSAQDHDLTELLSRMQARLSTDTPPTTLPRAVAALLAHVEAEGSLRLHPHADLFDDDGKLTQGPVVRVGKVAAAWMTDPPAPLIATTNGLQTATRMVGGRAVRGEAQIVRMVLQDPDAPPALDAFVTTGWRAKMDAGGPIMWVLLWIGVGALLVIVERTIGLTWSTARWKREQARFENAVRERRVNTLLHVEGWLAKPLVVAASARCPSCTTPAHGDTEERATQALMVMRERLLRRLSLVNVAAGVAPLLGLLGTVTGMIHTFSVVTTTGTSEPQMLAEGISQALLTTQFGLAIAIPAFLGHALLSRAARRILASAEQTVLWYLHGTDLGHYGHDHDHHDHDHDHDHHDHSHVHGRVKGHDAH